MLSVFLILWRVFDKNPNISVKNLWRTPPIDRCWIPMPFSATKSLYQCTVFDINGIPLTIFHSSVMHDHFHMVSKYLHSLWSLSFCPVFFWSLFDWEIIQFVPQSAGKGTSEVLILRILWGSMPPDPPRGSGPSGLPLRALWPCIYMLLVKSWVLHLL